MKTKIKLKGNSRYNDWTDGDTGYVDGYLRGADERPYAVVVLDKDKSFCLCEIHCIESIGLIENN